MGRTFLGLGSFQFLSFVRRGVFYSFMYIYLFTLMGNVTTTAALGTLNMVASTAGQNLLWGRISDRYGLRRRLIVAGEVLAGFSYLMVFYAHRIILDAGERVSAGLVIITGLSMLEFFWSMSDVGWAALLTDVTTPGMRGGFVGALNFLASLGRMVGVLWAGFLYGDGAGFRDGTIFYIVSAMLFTGSAIMWFALGSNESAAAVPSEGLLSEGVDRQGFGVMVGVLRGHGEGAFNWFLISLTIIVLGSASINQVFLFFLQLEPGLNAGDLGVSIVLMAWTMGGMATSFLWGRVADRVGRFRVILTGSLLAAVTPLLYGSLPDVASMAFVYGLNGVAVMAIQTAGFALAGDIIPEERRGRLFGRYNAVMALSWGPAGFLVGGPVTDLQTGVMGLTRHTAYVNAFFVSSILVLLGTGVFVLRLRKSGGSSR